MIYTGKMTDAKTIAAILAYAQKEGNSIEKTAEASNRKVSVRDRAGCLPVERLLQLEKILVTVQ